MDSFFFPCFHTKHRLVLDLIMLILLAHVQIKLTFQKLLSAIQFLVRGFIICLTLTFTIIYCWLNIVLYLLTFVKNNMNCSLLFLVSEHVVMMILSLVRNYIPSYQYIKEGGWNIADCVSRSYDVEGMKVGTVAAGRIGLAVLKRMHPFDCELHYCDRHRLPKEVEEKYNLHHWTDWKEMVRRK